MRNIEIENEINLMLEGKKKADEISEEQFL